MSESKHEPVSVCIIGKNCAKNLKALLRSVKPFVLPHLGDEVVYLDTGSTDHGRTIGLARKWNCRVLQHPELSDGNMVQLVKDYLPEFVDEVAEDPQFDGGFISDFAAARQIVTDAAKNDLILWLDTDDILENPENLRAYVHQATEAGVNAIFLAYDYAFDPDGACTTVLWRERVVRRSKYEWLGVCHETLIPKNRQPERVHRCPAEIAKVLHKNHRPSKWSDVRNFAILFHAYNQAVEAGEWVDPRWEFYLGNALRGLGRYEDAVTWYTQVLEHSGSREDRFTAAANIATIYQIKGRHWRSMDWWFQALKIFPSEPRAYFGVARCWYDLKRYPEAVHWTELGKTLPKPETLTAVDPNGYDFYPQIYQAFALRELKDWPNALQAAEAARALRPEFEAARALPDAIRQEATNAQIEAAIRTTISQASAPSEAHKIVQALRPELRQGIRAFQTEGKRDRPDDTITFVCGGTVEPWDATSSADGIGGSEKMVLLLSRGFASRGRKVEVFGNPKQENLWKTIDGIQWKPYEAFNPESRYGTLIIWRQHGYLNLPLKANKLFVDLHDVQNPGDYVEGRQMKVDGYLFKSDFHASTVRDIVDPAKLIITRNAIVPAQFPEKIITPRKQKIVFCSSADRGLKEALRIWKRVAPTYRQAELHVFYGFTPLYKARAAQAEYVHFGDEGCDRHMLDYEEECYTLMDSLPRVHFHGRVSHEELANHLSEASIWLYPTKFPEISCMVAMEAQAAGAIPVVYPTGALAETVFAGHGANDADGAVIAIREVLNKGQDLDTARQEMADEARRRFDIDQLVTDWLEIFDAEHTL